MPTAAAPHAAPRDLHVRILYAAIDTIDVRWRHRLCSPFWRLYCNDADGAAIDTPAGSYPLPMDAVVLVPSWGAFTSRSARSVRHCFIHFEPVGLQRDWLQGHGDRPLILPADRPRAALVRALVAGDRAQAGWRLRAQAVVLESLAAALDRLPPTVQASFVRWHEGSDRIAPALRQIEDQLAMPLAVPRLARACGLSGDHFARLFRERTGLSPARYVAERRIAVAAEHLIAGDEAIEAIARVTGFANRYHFTRVFTRVMGVPPGGYRKGGRV